MHGIPIMLSSATREVWFIT